ncbi:MAG TPA: hypothetical protein VLD65_12435 [Anaerolineales bacterium]|nr:hypothetical protein [Anaerolineales bacterium]
MLFVGVGVTVDVAVYRDVLVNVGGMNGVLVGVGVCVMVGVGVIVPVAVIVTVWLGVIVPVGVPGVMVLVAVCVANTTNVQVAVIAGVRVIGSFLPGARSTKTRPAQ